MYARCVTKELRVPVDVDNIVKPLDGFEVNPENTYKKKKLKIE